MNIITICSRIIEYSFYALFFTVPLIFTSNTSELFEFNKMWLTFAITIVIAGAWATEVILQRRILLCRTPLDIPILLFLASQIITTVFSLDTHTSLWGYYSRFNGGLLSTLSYILLYYAFVSHFDVSIVKRLLFVSLVSGLIVALWGLPAHFGYDPTCFLFRQTLDVSCWTEDFKPTIRIFSTLGQPNWLATYLIVLTPLTIMLAVLAKKTKLLLGVFLLLTLLFYVDLLFTQSRSGFFGFAMAILIMTILVVLKKTLLTRNMFFVFCGLLLLLLAVSFPLGTPVSSQIESFFKTSKEQPTQQTQSAGQTGGTQSSAIRLIVWQGALDVWKAYPLFGSGVETFAYAYYKHRPVGHNMTSEWDYLYNKAHNEYLNYLATTGIFGLGSYVLIIIVFISLSIGKILNLKFIIFNENLKLKIENSPENSLSTVLSIALIASYVGILVSNFFGFSVVIVNLYFFLIPAFVFILERVIDPKHIFVFPQNADQKEAGISEFRWVAIVILLFPVFYLLFTLLQFWIADTSYAYGANLQRAGEYERANEFLKNAVQLRGGEPTFHDEYAFNNAALAAMYAYENQATKAAEFANTAIAQSSKLVQEHPNNVVFWKTQVRIFSILGQVDPQYYQYGLNAIQNAKILAPTDAKISYSLAVLYGQTGDTKKAVETLEETIKLKPDYQDAYYALGLYYHDLATDEKGKVVDEALQEKAVATMQYILQKLSPNDKQATQALETWGR